MKVIIFYNFVCVILCNVFVLICYVGIELEVIEYLVMLLMCEWLVLLIWCVGLEVC